MRIRNSMIVSVRPGCSRVKWLLHRLCLKGMRPWFVYRWLEGEAMTLRYRVEGKIHYVFQVKGSDRLLRITRNQFYNPESSIDTSLAQKNSMLMNELADANISVKAEHLRGGALLVDDAGMSLLAGASVARLELRDLFERITNWSLNVGKVVLDYNEGNWCVRDGVMVLIDVDWACMCQLGDISKKDTVTKRVQDIRSFSSNADILKEFLRQEEILLSSWLEERGQLR